MYSIATQVTSDFTNSFIHSKVGLILNSLGMKRSTQTYINQNAFYSTSKMNFISFLFLVMQINALQGMLRGYDRRQLRREYGFLVFKRLDQAVSGMVKIKIRDFYRNQRSKTDGINLMWILENLLRTLQFLFSENSDYKNHNAIDPTQDLWISKMLGSK